VTEPTAADPWTVTLAWTPDQNHGYVSTLNGRAPIESVVGLIRGGEPLDRIAGEYGLTVEQVSVIARLAEEGWAS
jgi:uncharacterized protein (DUF433 family)